MVEAPKGFRSLPSYVGSNDNKLATPHNMCQFSNAFIVGIGGFGIMRSYKLFFLGGRCIFGPDIRLLVVTLTLIVTPGLGFCGFVGRKMVDVLPPHVGVILMVVIIVLMATVIMLLLMTSGRDPGIVPRNTRAPLPDEGLEAGSGQTGLPSEKVVMVNGFFIESKYCTTCMLYRPPRCSHCAFCDNCVDKFDHHCSLLGQCIGRRNYRLFFMFLASGTLYFTTMFALCWVYVTRVKEISVVWALIMNPAACVLIVYSFTGLVVVGSLTGYHLYLIGTNQSTNEHIKYDDENPYNKGILGNFREVFWDAIRPSKINLRAILDDEPEFVNEVVEVASSYVELTSIIIAHEGNVFVN